MHDDKESTGKEPVALSPIERGRRFHEMLNQVNCVTGNKFTMKEAAAALGVNYATFRNLEALWHSPCDTSKHNIEDRLQKLRNDIMSDPTEAIRRVEISQLNVHPGSRKALEAKHGQVWDTKELQQDFAVKGFMAPYIVVERRCDHVVGSLRFQHDPRIYFQFKED